MAAQQLAGNGALTEFDVQEDEGAARARTINARVCLYLFLARAIQNAIATRDFLDIYLFDISGTNELVGQVESTRGIASLLMLVPMGMLSDWLERLMLLRYLALVKAIPVAISAYGVATDNLSLLWPSLVLLAIVNQAFDQVLQVLLVDNVPEASKRTRILSLKEVMTWGGSAVGPLLALLIIFAQSSFGESHESRDPSGWSLNLVRSIVIVGLSSFVLVEPSVVLLRSTTESVQARDRDPSESSDAAGHGEVPAWTEVKVCKVRKRWIIPIWTDVSWAVIQIGGSFSLSYVSLFFRKDFNLSPTSIMLFRFFENAGLALMMRIVPPVTARLGRAWSAILFTLVAAALIESVAISHVAWMAAVLFILRTTIGRANVPCIQSILFECVAKRHRGRWSAVTAFKSATNGAGAWVGGYLADRTGDYRAAFMLTGAVQAVGALFLIPVSLWLP